jgi:hypothetical protein
METLYFRGGAAFAALKVYEWLETEGIGYVVRLPTNPVLQVRIRHLLTRPMGRPPQEAAGVLSHLELAGSKLD